MFHIWESQNFLWSNENILGHGATATVFQGVCKLNGDSVAVKFYNCSTPQPQQLQELEVLKKIKHENIVKLIAIETSLTDRKRVIVMELCTGGSLLNILMDPKNAYGLEESEFLLVLKHLYGGVKYLRENNIIHRDIKPGNIIKCIGEDGTSIYKLTDFGAARELAEDESFQSIHGTKEYVQPDIYERAILGRLVNKKFNCSGDLWSIGVTLYHVATGTLPFAAFKGHKHKETFHYITTKKDSGVISGIQATENGSIIWSRKLPDTCLLSDGLKTIITPLIAGLLESDPSKIWGFDKFFKEVEKLLSHIIVNIFYVNKAKLIKIYALPQQQYEDFRQYITKQTEIESDNQFLLHKNKFLEKLIQNNTSISEYPKTSVDCPLFLYNKINIDFSVPAIHIPALGNFPINISLEEDTKIAQSACITGHYCERQIERYSTYCKLIYDFIGNLDGNIDNNLKDLELNLHQLSKETDIFEKPAKLLDSLQDTITGNCDGKYYNKIQNISTQLVSLTSRIANVCQCFHKLIWNTTITDLKCPFKSKVLTRANIQVEEIRQSWQYFKNEPIIPDLPYNKYQWYVLKSKQIKEKLSNVINLLEKETIPQYQQIVKEFEKWYKSIQEICIEINALKTNFERCEKELQNFKSELTTDYIKHIENKERLFGNHVDNEQVRKLKYFEKCLEKYSKRSANFNEIILENTRLINLLQNLGECLKL